MADDEIILSELDDEELVAQMFDDLYDGLKEEIEEGVHILLERGHQLLQDAGHERPDAATSSAPLLVARILLTILPAAEPRDAGAAAAPQPPA